MRFRVMAIVALLALYAAVVQAQSGNDLFQQALVRQNVDLDIEGAIKIYGRIIRDFSSNRALTARALVQLGLSYELLGQAKSREYYEQVILKYPDQTESVAEARNRLSAAEAVVQIPTPPTEDPFGFGVSPGGRSVVFAVAEADKGQLWLHDLATGKASPIPGADFVWPTNSPLPAGNRSAPFWSPDGGWIAYFADGKLKRIPATGGTAQILADAPFPLGGTWNQDGIIVFATVTGGLSRVAADGSGPPIRLGAGACPNFLPDGRRFLFFRSADAIWGQGGQMPRHRVRCSRGYSHWLQRAMTDFGADQCDSGRRHFHEDALSGGWGGVDHQVEQQFGSKPSTQREPRQRGA